jgi:hypothetical protein
MFLKDIVHVKEFFYKTILFFHNFVKIFQELFFFNFFPFFSKTKLKKKYFLEKEISFFVFDEKFTVLATKCPPLPRKIVDLPVRK